MGLIYQPNYIPPQPMPDVEERVRKELQAIDPLLDITWVDDVVPNPAHQLYEGRYALICRWPASDGRWQAVREDGYTDAYDMLGWFCEDPANADSIPQDPYNMMALIYKLLQNADSEEAPWYERMSQVFGKNLDRMRDNKQMLDDEVTEIAERSYSEFEYKNPQFGYGD